MTITQLRATCWTLDPPPSSPGDPCYGSIGDADDALAELEDHDPARAAERPSPCWIVTCRGCGDGFIDSETSVSHFASPEEAARFLKADGWIPDGAGFICAGCAAGERPDDRESTGQTATESNLGDRDR